MSSTGSVFGMHATAGEPAGRRGARAGRDRLLAPTGRARAGARADPPARARAARRARRSRASAVRRRAVRHDAAIRPFSIATSTGSPLRQSRAPRISSVPRAALAAPPSPAPDSRSCGSRGRSRVAAQRQAARRSAPRRRSPPARGSRERGPSADLGRDLDAAIHRPRVQHHRVGRHQRHARRRSSPRSARTRRATGSSPRSMRSRWSRSAITASAPSSASSTVGATLAAERLDFGRHQRGGPGTP